MKNILKRIAFMIIVATGAFLLKSCTSNIDPMADNWTKVVITKNPNDVKSKRMTQKPKLQATPLKHPQIRPS